MSHKHVVRLADWLDEQLKRFSKLVIAICVVLALVVLAVLISKVFAAMGVGQRQLMLFDETMRSSQFGLLLSFLMSIFYGICAINIFVWGWSSNSQVMARASSPSKSALLGGHILISAAFLFAAISGLLAIFVKITMSA